MCDGDRVSAWDDEEVLEADAGRATCECAQGRRAAPSPMARALKFMFVARIRTMG